MGEVSRDESLINQERDELDTHDIADVRASLEEMKRGEVVDAKDIHAALRRKYLTKM
jgi:hypothetical protein